MRKRPAAWLVFFAFLFVATIGILAGSENLVDLWLRHAVWAIWIALSIALAWKLFRSDDPAERRRLIDSRGVYLLPRSWRHWLFD
jgi:hypothetical protein